MTTKTNPSAEDSIEILDHDDGVYKAASLGSLPVSTPVQTAINLKLNSAFVPGESADWDGDPATVQEAIDRLASAVAGLLTTPIP